MTYSFQEVHAVEAAVVFCLDPRFFDVTVRFIREELGLKTTDNHVCPGGPKTLVDEKTSEIFLQEIGDISVSLHHATKVVLIAHRDCGKYGGSRAFSDPKEERMRQVGDLIKAKNAITERFPGVQVRTYYLEIVGKNEIEFQAL
jgi:hypothetical protein